MNSMNTNANENPLFETDKGIKHLYKTIGRLESENKKLHKQLEDAKKRNERKLIAHAEDIILGAILLAFIIGMAVFLNSTLPKQ